MFVHLHCHSHYSFLRGVPSPEEIVAAAVAQKMPAVALTDTNGLYAAIPFYQAAREAGVKPIVGATLGVEAGDKTSFRTTLTLLVENAQGYRHLCELLTLRHLGGSTMAQNGGDERPVTFAELAAHSKGLIALYPVMRDSPVAHLAQLKDIFSTNFWLEVRHLSPGDGRILREAILLGKKLSISLVATNNVHFLTREEHLHHRAMNAVRTGALLTTVTAPEITTPEAWFKSVEEMRKLFPDHPELLQATCSIAEQCNLQLELGKLIFPQFPVPAGESPFSFLWKLSFAGAQKHYQPLRPEVLARLTHELELIEKLHLAPYFLLVWDIVEEARRRGIPAIARGSAASSLVAYCLGISCVCPLRWELYFERFLNVERGDCPDIDIDICGARRDELLDYVYERWGAEHVAMIGSFITMHARLAVCEIAKVFGVPPAEVNHFTGRLPRRPMREILQAIRALPECRDLPINDEPWKTILQVALRLDDAPRHLGIHPCGTVISARPLAQLVPLERATKGIVVTQYDMNAIEALGLIKMDLLGQRGFTTMSLTLDNIDKSHGTEGSAGSLAIPRHKKNNTGRDVLPAPRILDFGAIPENDPTTCDVIASGRTLGVFQIESPAMRGLLRTMKARTLEEIAMALALIRPGASEYGSKELFLKRLRGQAELEYPHPSLQTILKDSLGVCVYQEQVMQIAQAIGGMGLAEADIVRRSAAKISSLRERERLRGKFLKAAELMGLSGAEREEIWMMVEKFAGFGFCKAHAATYADISYRMTYLKTHHTAEFLAAMCSAGAGFYHVSAYVEEAKRWGISVRLPCVNRSRLEYTTEPEETGKRCLRVGLMQVKGLRMETIHAIVQSRTQQGAYRSLEDFLARVAVERDEIEALIKCGAFDEVSLSTRPELLWRRNLLQAATKKNPQRGAGLPASSLFPGAGRHDEAGASLGELRLPHYSLEQKRRYEYEILEVCVAGHPLDFFPRNGEVWSDDLPRLRGERVALCGWVVTHRHVGTKNCRNMMFVTLEDQRGIYEVVLFPDAYEKCGGMVFESRALRVTGRVEQGDQINGETLTPLRK
ncbi:MAG: DNA polymerase III subunit alpha [Candidatus Acidiferrum sp.]